MPRLCLLVEAAGYYNEFVTQGRTEFAPKQAQLQNNVAMAYLKSNRFSEALVEIDRAEAGYRTLFAREPTAYSAPLVNCLESKAQILAELQSWPEVKTLSAEGLRLLHTARAQSPGAYAKVVDILTSLYLRACKELHQRPDAKLLHNGKRAGLLQWLFRRA